MKFWKKLVILTLLASVLGGCATTTTREHPNLEERLLAVEKVVVAPPAINIELLTFTGENERMDAKEELIGNLVMDHVHKELTASGFEIIEFDFNQAIEKDENFAFIVNQVQEGFSQARADLEAGRPIPAKEKRKHTASVGSVVNEVAEKTGADAVLLLSYNGFQKSKGMVAKDVSTSVLVGVLTLGNVVPIQQAAGATMEAALIDGVTGEVLWTDVRVGGLDGKVANAVFKSFPDDIDPVIKELNPAEGVPEIAIQE